MIRKCGGKVKSLGLLGTYGREIRSAKVKFEEQMAENIKHSKEILQD